MGVGKEGPGPWILKLYIFPLNFQQKKVVFLVSSGQNEIAPLLIPLEKSFLLPLEKSSLFPLEKVFPAPMAVPSQLEWICESIHTLAER